MNITEVKNDLTRIAYELNQILGRFTKSTQGIHIAQDDDMRVKSLVLDLKEIFEDEFVDGSEYKSEVNHHYMDSISKYIGSPSYHGVESIKTIVMSAINRIDRNPDILKDANGGSARTLRAYKDLDLHPEIARAASSLYSTEHYANAVEASVKALNDLVRLRSGETLDGSALMERVFNTKNPILKFNDLKNQSDTDEQRGFQMLFSGAVAGLRNPRAHGFIKDSPERALEFIAFVSLLAKLLDGANK